MKYLRVLFPNTLCPPVIGWDELVFRRGACPEAPRTAQAHWENTLWICFFHAVCCKCCDCIRWLLLPQYSFTEIWAGPFTNMRHFDVPGCWGL